VCNNNNVSSGEKNIDGTFEGSVDDPLVDCLLVTLTAVSTFRAQHRAPGGPWARATGTLGAWDFWDSGRNVGRASALKTAPDRPHRRGPC
jgi:hypothetical protein